MIKSHRNVVNKHRSAGKFRHAVGKTHPKNVQARPMRGGFRL